MTRIGLITGSGTYELPGLSGARSTRVVTRFGDVEVNHGDWHGLEVLHIARHGVGHIRLSSAVNHRANVTALKALRADCVIGMTVCGAIDPMLQLGSLVIFDDLHFTANRLPDGSLCTLFDEIGAAERGHWVYHGSPFSPGLRELLAQAASAGGDVFQAGGVYGHVDGPRFNTAVEIAQLAAAGVSAVSQTGGPEAVLCGEALLPFALVGYVTDYANGVKPDDPTSPEKLLELIGHARSAFLNLLESALPLISIGAGTIKPVGTVLRSG
ncbi:MAG: MTAP family purine nucleoside phosphorylase [Solirubrobacteraceae bacterium]